MAAVTKADLAAQVARLRKSLGRAKAETAALARSNAEALEREAATAGILKIISRSPADVQPVFEAIARDAQKLCASSFANVFRYDGKLMHFVASHQLNPEQFELVRRAFPLPPDRSWVAGRAILSKRVVCIEDALIDPEYDHSVAAGAGWRSIFAAPIMRAGEVLGSIAVGWPEPGAIPAARQDLLKTFADQAAIAIENVRLFNETKEALERQTATAEILKVISSSPTDVQPVFDAIARNAVALCGGAYGAVFCYDGEQLHFAAGHHLSPGVMEEGHARFPMRADDSLVSGRAVLSRTIACVEDVATDEQHDNRFASAGGWRRMLGAPMLREGVPIGVIFVAWAEPGPIPKAQQQLVQTFADQAVIAIENVRLFNETKEALERQTTTAEILRVIASSPTDAQPVFDALCLSAARLCDGNDTCIYRVDGNRLRIVGHHGTVATSDVPLERGSAVGRAVLDRQPVHVLDLMAESREFPEGSEFAQRFGHRTTLGLPLLCEGVPIGGFLIRRTEVRAFTATQIQLLQTFADQAVIAIENVRLFNETREALERQTATAEILKVISSSPTDVQPVFEAIAQNGVRLCNGGLGFVLRFDGELITFAAHHNVSRQEWQALQSLWPMRPHTESIVGRAVLERRVVQAHDYQVEFPRYAAQLPTIRSVVAVPMLRAGVPIGVLTIFRREIAPFTRHQIDLLQTFADQAVIAIENVRLFNETKEALERQTATAEILKVISSSPTDVQPVFDTIAACTLRLCEGMFSVVTRYDGSLIHLAAISNAQPEASEGIRSRWPAPADRANATTRAVAERRIVQIPDVQDDAEYGFGSLAELAQYRSVLAVPMLREGSAIGAVTVVRVQTGWFSEHQVSLLQTFADQAVIAIENVRLFNETREALEQQTAISEILRVISSSPSDVTPVLDAVVERAMRICDSNDARIFLVEGGALRYAAGRGDVKAVEIGTMFPLERGLVMGRAVIDKLPVHVDDLATESEGEYALGRQVAQAFGFRTTLSVPLLRESEAFGAILLRRQEVRPFGAKQIALLKTFADQAAIAIENVRLFNELKARTEALGRSVRQLTALGDVGQAISSSLDLETVLQTIVQRAAQLTGLDGAEIFEYDESAGQFHLRTAENLDAGIVEALRSTPMRKGEGAIGRTALTGEPTEITDILDASYQSRMRELLVGSGYRALLAVPLLREGHLLGALVVNRKAPGPFPPDVVDLLKTFASQSAVAIQNARLFREIADKSRQLEDASRHKSRFLASMSHELRTPLNAILGFNEMLLDELYGPVPEAMKEPLADIQTSGKHLLRLINNVLDLAKIEAGRMELALADYSVQDTLESVRSTLRPLAESKGLEFVVTAPEGLPLAYGDSGRITQCLVNLAGNSLKFTKAGRIEIEVDCRGGTLAFRVADTGIGIAPEKIGGLFTEFKQTDATIASEYGGSGLGLSICRKFVEMHGGRIWAESEPGRGSTFSFEIPLRARERTAA